jgi:3alpha(or 20beta)-hydroxysteroid dehydrogenase
VRLQDRVAIITGAAQGQGAAEARLFVAEGASVVLTDVEDGLGRAVAAELGERARFVHHDVSSEDDWARVVAEATDAFGGIDVLVNNAAMHRLCPVRDEQLDSFLRVLAVNLGGVFLGIRSVVPSMEARGGGSIVNISSIAGLVGLEAHGAYGSAKWGVRWLTKVAALELGSVGIRVNSVHPGAIDTRMLPPDVDGLGDARFAGVPIPRAGRPEEVAELVLFLASTASSYLTGSEIAVDGGYVAGPR